MLWLGLFIIIGALLYSAYSQLKPESFVALISEEVQKNYPGTELEVGKVTYGFSLDFNLKLQNIALKRANAVISTVGEIELKVPWWLLLTNRGNAQVNISKLDIFIEHDEKKVSIVKEEAKKAVTSIKVSLPQYLSDARFTVRAKEVSVRDIVDSRRYFTVSKMLVREFQYGKNSAFELNIPIEIKHHSNSYTSDLWLFGDITPERDVWELNYRGDFRAREVSEKFQMDDIVIHGKTIFRPASLDLKSQVDLLIDRESIGKGVLNANRDALNLKMYFTAIPVNYFSFVYEEINNPYLVKMDGQATGEIKFTKELISGLAELEGKLSFDGEFQLNEKTPIPGKWQISFTNPRWDVSFMSPKAEVSYFRRSVIDMKSNKIMQYNEELGFMGLELRQTLPAVRPLRDFTNQLSSPYFVTSISCKKCLQGEKVIDGNFKYGFSPDQKFYQAELVDALSSFKVNYSDKTEQNAIDLSFKNFQWLVDYHFLTPYFDAKLALLEGKIEGRWNESWILGKWLIQLNALKLEEASGWVPDFISHTAGHFDLDSKKSQTQRFDVSVQNNVINLNSLWLEDSERFKIYGSLSEKQKSMLWLSRPKNKKIKPIKKEINDPYWINEEEL